ncbi:hypothetical protein FSS13T_05000 [Flavobacterium saliperosum S13]|uniref:Uncharacterized protein n=1 Tax=Flavobacterium saliperosum S13 TaxID=1341155 RepID=A0ABP2ZZR0_9FLAO|nr:hypothetical protein FSS13T_05000 [Flavobacterium saliperosum S13]
MWEIGVKILFHKDINIFRINNDFQYLKKIVYLHRYLLPN